MHDDVYHQYARVLSEHWWTKNRRELTRWALSEAGIEPGAGLRILELGSGVGAEFEFLSEYGTVTGVEISPVGLKYCEQCGYEKLINADLNDFVPELGSYDLIVDFHVLYHEWIKAPRDVLSKLRTGLKPGGILLNTEPGFEVLRRGHDRSVMGGRRFSVMELRELLVDAGYTVDRSSAFTSLLSPVLLAMATYERLRPIHTTQTHVAELEQSPRVVQAGLRAVMALERRLIKAVPLPFGGSVIALARTS